MCTSSSPRTSTPRTELLVTLIVLAAGTAAGGIAPPSCPTPAATILAAAERAQLDPGAVARAWYACGQGVCAKPCRWRLSRVLRTLARRSPLEAAAIIAGLETVEDAAPGAIEGQTAQNLVQDLRGVEGEGIAQQVPTPPAARWYRAYDCSHLPRWGSTPTPEFQAHLLACLDVYLGDDPRERTRGALRLAVLQECPADDDTGLSRLCEAAGQYWLSWAAGRIAVEALENAAVDEYLVETYLGIDQAVLECAIERGERQAGDTIAHYIILRRWLDKRPSRWKAWKDVEEMLPPSDAASPVSRQDPSGAQRPAGGIPLR